VSFSQCPPNPQIANFNKPTLGWHIHSSADSTMHRLIEHNAKLVAELHKRIHDEFRKEPYGPTHHAACSEFHERYDGLAFPGGYASGLAKLKVGDAEAIEAALAFLEVRPYFFRSQYMMKKLTRLLKHARLSASQSERFEKIRTLMPKTPNQTQSQPIGGSA
jgi:hypothetical protein